MSHPPILELYQGDLPQGRFAGRIVAIDTETLGLTPIATGSAWFSFPPATAAPHSCRSTAAARLPS